MQKKISLFILKNIFGWLWGFVSFMYLQHHQHIVIIVWMFQNAWICNSFNLYISFRKILFSHLFWLDSHLFCQSDFKQNKFECMGSSHALRGSQNHGVTKSDRQKRCESNQKRCENRIFLLLLIF
jgi:hypothetical protein